MRAPTTAVDFLFSHDFVRLDLTLDDGDFSLLREVGDLRAAENVFPTLSSRRLSPQTLVQFYQGSEEKLDEKQR